MTEKPVDQETKEDQEPPPFTPEQLVWIDRLIANRQGQLQQQTCEPLPQSVSADPLKTPASAGKGRLQLQIGVSGLANPLAYCNHLIISMRRVVSRV